MLPTAGTNDQDTAVLLVPLTFAEKVRLRFAFGRGFVFVVFPFHRATERLDAEDDVAPLEDAL